MITAQNPLYKADLLTEKSKSEFIARVGLGTAARRATLRGLLIASFIGTFELTRLVLRHSFRHDYTSGPTSLSWIDGESWAQSTAGESDTLNPKAFIARALTGNSDRLVGIGFAGFFTSFLFSLPYGLRSVAFLTPFGTGLALGFGCLEPYLENQLLPALQRLENDFVDKQRIQK